MMPSRDARCSQCGQVAAARVEDGLSIIDCPSCGLHEVGPFCSTDWMYLPGQRLTVSLSWDAPISLRLAHQLKQLVPEFAEASARELLERLAGHNAWSVVIKTSMADAVALSEKAKSLGVKAVVSSETLPPLRTVRPSED